MERGPAAIRVDENRGRDTGISLTTNATNYRRRTLGLSRTQRAQGPEGGALLTPLAEEDWFKCETGEDLEECYESLKASTTEPIRADNTFKHPTLCGKVVIAQAEPVPWSYRDLYEQTHIPEGMIEMQVTCEN
ncbi:hypothetical protein CXR25_17085 [Brevibacterium aurantiacum]|nr:hypothetical protein CXR25_17085 [Brevibacterium aurantiacum]